MMMRVMNLSWRAAPRLRVGLRGVLFGEKVVFRSFLSVVEVNGRGVGHELGVWASEKSDYMRNR